MKNFRVLSLILAFVFAGFLTQNVQAQFSAGAGLAFGSEIEELGLNLRVGYGVNENIDAIANYTFWFVEGDGASASSFNIDGHYNFIAKESMDVYALAGLNGFRVKVDLGPFGNASATEYGLNLGGGVNFGLSEKLDIFGEAKYVISDADQLVIAAGVMFAF